MFWGFIPLMISLVCFSKYLSKENEFPHVLHVQFWPHGFTFTVLID